MCTKFGIDSSNRFPVGALTGTHTQTDSQTDTAHHPIPCIGYAGMG